MNANHKYSTSSFYPACFLLAKGMHLTGIDRTNPHRCEFVFEDSPEREGLLRDFSLKKEGKQKSYG